jgi:hypothetical protein
VKGPKRVAFYSTGGRDESTGAFVPMAFGQFPEEEIGLGLDIAERSQPPSGAQRRLGLNTVIPPLVIRLYFRAPAFA